MVRDEVRTVIAIKVVAFAFTIACASNVVAQLAPLPSDSSTQVKEGAKLYQEFCVVCHEEKGRDAAAFPRPIWGDGADLAKFATTRGLFEYLQLMMPFDNPAKINDQQKTSILAYLSVRHGAIKPSATLPVGGNTEGLK